MTTEPTFTDLVAYEHKRNAGAVRYNIFSPHHMSIIYGDLGTGYEPDYHQIMHDSRLGAEIRTGRLMPNVRR